MIQSEKHERKWLLGLLLFIVLAVLPVTAQAAVKKSISTGIKHKITAVGEYSNWEGVSSVSQFRDNKNNYCFAYDGKKNVTVVVTKKGKVKRTVKLAKKRPTFGAVTCDKEGNYYLVTGKENTGSDTSKNTVFVSKYNASGKHIKTIGDNGSSSLDWYYPEAFFTQTPFYGGNCDVAINGNYLAVHYGRLMYGGHQSDSVWIINISRMKTVSPIYPVYSSHSFGQRAVKFGNGFLFASEGDAYDRAFEISQMMFEEDDVAGKQDSIFHFWLEEGASNNMYKVNENFALIGDLVNLGNGNAAFVGISAKSLSAKAEKERQQLFIQIFDPAADLSTAGAYVTKGKRSGLSGLDGDQQVTDYGVKWLTSYKTEYIDHPQAVSDGKGNTIILYELYSKSFSYQGVYYLKVDATGKVTVPKTLYSKTAYLNPCETPVYTNKTVYWTGNKKGDSKMYVYTLQV